MNLYNLYKHELISLFLHLKYFSLFFVSLYQGLLEVLSDPTWDTFLACLIDLDNLYEVSGCSIVTDFKSPVFGFHNVFGF